MTGDKKDKMPECIIKMEAPKLMGKMVADDARFLLYPWTWMVSATHRAAGPEYCALPSVRYTLTGQRSILLIEFESLRRFSRSTVGPGGTLSLGSVMNLVSEASDQMIASMQSAGVKMMWCVAGEQTWLFVPWGWIVVEKADNNEVAGGYRYNMPCDVPTDAYYELVQFMVPDKGTIKPNSIYALLNKILEACTSAFPEKQPRAQQARIKSEPDQDGLLIKSEPSAKRHKGF